MWKHWMCVYTSVWFPDAISSWAMMKILKLSHWARNLIIYYVHIQCQMSYMYICYSPVAMLCSAKQEYSYTWWEGVVWVELQICYSPLHSHINLKSLLKACWADMPHMYVHVYILGRILLCELLERVYWFCSVGSRGEREGKRSLQEEGIYHCTGTLRQGHWAWSHKRHLPHKQSRWDGRRLSCSYF
jgi:hypothetical protein